MSAEKPVQRVQLGFKALLIAYPESYPQVGQEPLHLFLQRRRGTWDLPGGRLDFAKDPQTPFAALGREALQETGFKIVRTGPNKPIVVFMQRIVPYDSTPGVLDVIRTTEVARLEVPGLVEPQLSPDEHIDFKWATLRFALSNLALDNSTRVFGERRETQRLITTVAEAPTANLDVIQDHWHAQSAA